MKQIRLTILHRRRADLDPQTLLCAADRFNIGFLQGWSRFEGMEQPHIKNRYMVQLPVPCTPHC